jgi:hypothetical protein
MLVEKVFKTVRAALTITVTHNTIECTPNGRFTVFKEFETERKATFTVG